MLDALARLSAIFAGLVLVAITMVTCWSIFSRTVFDSALLGDVELVQIGMAFGVTAFLPICQIKRGNIIVDFFTSGLGAPARHALDRVGCLAIAAVCALLAWRTALGGLNSLKTGTVTMLMGFPEWVAYFAMVPPLALTTAIALVQTFIPLSAAGESRIDPARETPAG